MTCWGCDGTGWDDTADEVCFWCQGAGWIDEDADDADDDD